MKLVLPKTGLRGRWVGGGNTDSLHLLLQGLCSALRAGFHRASRPALWRCCSGLMGFGGTQGSLCPGLQTLAQLLGPSFRGGAWVGRFFPEKTASRQEVHCPSLDGERLGALVPTRGRRSLTPLVGGGGGSEPCLLFHGHTLHCSHRRDTPGPLLC